MQQLGRILAATLVVVVATLAGNPNAIPTPQVPTKQSVAVAQSIPDCVEYTNVETIEDWEPGHFPGETIEKSWGVRNCGSEPWLNRQLAIRYAETPDEYKNQGRRARDLIVRTSLPQLAPGQEGTASVTLRMPDVIPGKYKVWFDVVKVDEQRDLLWGFIETTAAPAENAE